MILFKMNNGDTVDFDELTVKKDLMTYLVQKTRMLGRQLTYDDAISDPTMILPNFYAYYFGSFSKAAQSAWNQTQASKRTTRKVVIPT